MNIRYSLFLLFICFVCNVHAQLIKVHGTVMTLEGEPIELATIHVAGGVAGGMSDLKGHYEFFTPKSDTVKLVISCLGFNKVERKIVSPDKEILLNVVLQSAFNALKDLEVTERKQETEMTQQIKLDRFRLMPDASGGSVESLLSTFAGVNSNNEMSSQYMVRGGNYDENSVYVNGIEVYRPLLIRAGQQEGLSFINPDLVQSIDFSAGGFDTRYGDKMSSVLDISYKKPELFEGSFAASLQGGSVYLGHATKKLTQIHGVRYKRNASLLGSLDTKGEYDPSFLDYQTYITYTLSPRWELSLLGNVSSNSYKFAPQNRTTKFGTQEIAKEFKVYFDGKEDDQFTTVFGALTLKHKIDKQTELGLMLSAFQTDEQERYDITGEYWLNDVEVSGESQRAIDKTLGVASYHEHARNKLKASVLNFSHMGAATRNSHTIRWGAGGQIEKITDRMREWEWRDSAGYSMPYNPNQVNVIYNLYSRNELNNTRLYSYLQDTYKFDIASGFVSVTGGLRASYWGFNKEVLISPRASIAYIPDWEKKFTFRFATGLYYQSPFYKEFRDSVYSDGGYRIQLNRNIKSQRSLQFIGGIDHYFYFLYRPFKFTVEAYYKSIDHLIPYTVDNVRVMYFGENRGSGHIAGLDMKIFGELVPGIDSWVSLSLMDSRERFDGKRMPRPTDQRYNISMFFQDYFPNNPKYKLQLKLVWADGLPFGPSRDEANKAAFRMSPYRRVDIGMSRQLVGGEDRVMRHKIMRHIKNVWLGVDVFNLFNISNVNSYYWITDVHNQQYAVPNYLTSRQINLRIVADF